MWRQSIQTLCWTRSNCCLNGPLRGKVRDFDMDKSMTIHTVLHMINIALYYKCNIMKTFFFFLVTTEECF